MHFKKLLCKYEMNKAFSVLNVKLKSNGSIQCTKKLSEIVKLRCKMLLKHLCSLLNTWS